MDDYDGIEIICECACRCGILDIEKYDDDSWSLSYYIPVMYGRTIGWKESLKIIWALFRGKQYYFYSFVLHNKQIEKLRDYLDK